MFVMENAGRDYWDFHEKHPRVLIASSFEELGRKWILLELKFFAFLRSELIANYGYRILGWQSFAKKVLEDHEKCIFRYMHFPVREACLSDLKREFDLSDPLVSAGKAPSLEELFDLASELFPDVAEETMKEHIKSKVI